VAVVAERAGLAERLEAGELAEPEGDGAASSAKRFSGCSGIECARPERLSVPDPDRGGSTA
jgi:hypothetical protein